MYIDPTWLLEKVSNSPRLAINGAKPVRETLLPYSRQTITQNDIDAVSKKLSSDWIAGKGPSVKQFEKEVAKYLGYEYAIAVNSATSGLFAVYSTLFRGIDREICIPNLTFIATANMALTCGLNIRLVDPNPETLTFDESDHIGVSYAGYPLDHAIVADDAHSFFPDMGYKRGSAHTHVAVISTHPVKPLTTGEGGVILTNNGLLYRQLYAFIDHGRGTYDEFSFGHNFRMPDINAELGLSQLKRAKGNLLRRRLIANKYYEAFKDISYLELPPYHVKHSWHLFVLRVRNGLDRDWFRKALKAEGIGSAIHYPPLSSYRHIRSNTQTQDDCPVTDDVWKNGLSIPIFSGMNTQDLQDVINAIHKVIGEL